MLIMLIGKVTSELHGVNTGP